jgi:hypothetical protein
LHPYWWRLPPPEVVDPEPSDSSSGFEDEVPEIIKVSSESEDEGFLELEADMQVKPEMDLFGLGEIDFEDPKVINLGRSRELMDMMVTPVMPLVTSR